MKPRKIILLSACAILLVISIFQIIDSHKNPVKVLSLKEDIDEIRIARPEGDLNLKKSGMIWVVNEKYRALDSTCDSLVDIFSSIRILNKVTKTDDENVLSKYDLDKDNVYTVTVYNDGNLLRTFYVGKSSSTNSQTYLRVDDSSDIYLVSGAIQNECSDSVDDIRSKILFELDRNDINTISVTHDGNTWALSRSSDGAMWSVSGAEEIEIDSEKASGWFQGCSTVSCYEWLPDGEKAPGEKIVTGKISTADKTVTLDLYETIDEEGDSEYWGECSELPYAFKASLYIVQRFRKNPEDFGK